MPTAKGQALADEYGIKFFETVSISFISFFALLQITLKDDVMRFFLLISANILIVFLQSAKTNLNVEQVFFSIAKDIKQRLADTDTKAEVFC